MASKATKIQGVDSSTFNLTINQFDEALQTNVQRLSQNIPQVDYSVHFTDGTTVRAFYNTGTSLWEVSLLRSPILSSQDCIFTDGSGNTYFEYDWEYPALITSPYPSELIIEWIRDNVVVNGVTNQVSVNYIQESAYRAFTNLSEQLYWIHP
jgi:hypothetical protein